MELREGKEILYLTNQDVIATGVTMKDIVDILDDVFREKGKNTYDMPPKIGIHPGFSIDYIHAMPCWAEKWDIAGIKWAGAFMNNKKMGLRYINGLIILNSPRTGYPLAIMDCTWISQMRTGGVNGVSAKYMAKKDSTTLGILATGYQQRAMIESMVVACPNLKHFYAWDLYPEASQKFAEEMGPKLGIEITPVATAKEAVINADIIVSGAPVEFDKDTSVVEKDWVKPGTTIITMDLDGLYKKDLVQEKVNKFFTDDKGTFEQFRYQTKSIPVIPEELGFAISGRVPGRENDEEIIFCANLGQMLDDLPVAREVFDRALAKGIGVKLPITD